MFKKTMKTVTSIVLAIAIACPMMPARPNASAAAKVKKMTLNKTRLSLDAGDKATIKVKKVVPKKASKAVAYKSSRKSVASVKKKGVVVAKKAGSANITVTAKSNKKVKKVVRVKVKNAASVNNSTANNIPSANNAAAIDYFKNAGDGESEYSSYSQDDQTVRSYIAETQNGYSIINANEKHVLIENYSKDFQLSGKIKIGMELPIFGGCFMGGEYNFMVFGQENPNEKNSVEIMRVVKYDKSWNRISSQGVYGANTTIPFRAGSLRMTESRGMLYIHTCHQMYMTEDGLNHQANMSYVLDENSMAITQYWYDVMNVGVGYVSHSFDQFVLTDGAYLYRLDLGDAYPRSVVLTKADINHITECSHSNILNIYGKIGDNDTGVVLGGFELAGSNLIAAGSSINQETGTGPSNIFIASTDKELSSTSINWLTNYTNNDVEVANPYLVKAGENELYVLWEEKSKESSVVKIVKINQTGAATSPVYTVQAQLSDCKPICASDGRLVWYSALNEKMIRFYYPQIDRLDGYKDKIDVGGCELSFIAAAGSIYVRWKHSSSTYYTSENDAWIASLTCGSFQLTEDIDYSILVKNKKIVISGKGVFGGKITRKIKFKGPRGKTHAIGINVEFEKTGNVSGYEVRYGVKKMKTKKTTKNRLRIKNYKSGTSVSFRVCGDINGKKTYSEWVYLGSVY